jgi:tetratricopeptide (TPR) repeat protein
VKRAPGPPTAPEKPRQPGRIRAVFLAIVVHAAFFALIVFGITWQSRQQAPAQVEIWDKLPAPAKAVATPEPPKPEVEPPKPEPPKPEPPKVVAKAEPPKPAPPKQPPPKQQPPRQDPPKVVAKADPFKQQPIAHDAPPKAKPDVETAYKQGVQQLARGDTQGALASLRTSLAGNPNYPPTWRGLGLVFEKLGEKDQARAAFKRYLQLAPGAGDAEQIKSRMERLGS